MRYRNAMHYYCIITYHSIRKERSVVSTVSDGCFGETFLVVFHGLYCKRVEQGSRMVHVFFHVRHASQKPGVQSEIDKQQHFIVRCEWSLGLQKPGVQSEIDKKQFQHFILRCEWSLCRSDWI